jgi:hypothetical protein
MTPTTLPAAALPRATARPPSPRRNEDHEPHLSGGARYASGPQTRATRPAGRSRSAGKRGRPEGLP